LYQYETAFCYHLIYVISLTLYKSDHIKQLSLYKFLYNEQIRFVLIKWKIIKLGGLDSRDQSRLRSRLLDLSRSTFETCQDFLDCQDYYFFALVKIVKIDTFELRFGCIKIFIEIVETNWDRQYLSILSRFLNIYWDILEFRHLWKVAREGFSLTFLSLPWVTL
jgi:hypothetical protein